MVLVLFLPSLHFVYSEGYRSAVVLFWRSQDAFPLIADPSRKWASFNPHS